MTWGNSWTNFENPYHKVFFENFGNYCWDIICFPGNWCFNYLKSSDCQYSILLSMYESLSQKANERPLLKKSLMFTNCHLKANFWNWYLENMLWKIWFQNYCLKTISWTLPFRNWSQPAGSVIFNKGVVLSFYWTWRHLVADCSASIQRKIFPLR